MCKNMRTTPVLFTVIPLNKNQVVERILKLKCYKAPKIVLMKVFASRLDGQSAQEWTK